MARFSPHVLIIRKFRRYPIKFIVCLLVVIYFSCVILIMVSEKIGFLEAIFMLTPSFLGDLGSEMDITPKGIASILGLFIYMAILGVLFGEISKFFLDSMFKGGVVTKKVNYKNHIVICGWNFQGPRIVENLLSGDIHEERPIVILADMEKVPLDSDDVDFVMGCPWKKEDLIRAGIPRADTTIILTDISGGKTSNPDAEALMIALAVESLNRDTHTCVQLLSSDNRIHLENANADEIICLDQVGGNLMVSSALNHGISNIIAKLLTFGQGCEVYRYGRKIPDNYIGKTFREIGRQLIDKKMNLIAIETKKDDYAIKQGGDDWIRSSGKKKIILLNPQKDYKLRENDTLFIISEEEPTTL